MRPSGGETDGGTAFVYSEIVRQTWRRWCVIAVSGCYTMEATGTDYRPNVITFQVVSAPSCPGCSISEPEIDNTVTK